jgi:hypothetical protein
VEEVDDRVSAIARRVFRRQHDECMRLAVQSDRRDFLIA